MVWSPRNGCCDRHRLFLGYKNTKFESDGTIPPPQNTSGGTVADNIYIIISILVDATSQVNIIF